MDSHQILITRISLVGKLMDAGIVGRKVANPFRSDYFAWLFPKSKEVCDIAAAYYLEIGKPLPKKFDLGDAD